MEAYIDIVLVNDDIYETSEMFDLIIDPSSNITVHNVDQARVIILNDDCK